MRVSRVRQNSARANSILFIQAKNIAAGEKRFPTAAGTAYLGTPSQAYA